jgi:hypothetical protein
MNGLDNVTRAIGTLLGGAPAMTGGDVWGRS